MAVLVRRALCIPFLWCLAIAPALIGQERWVLVHEDVLQRIYLDTLSLQAGTDSASYTGWFKYSFRERQKLDSLYYVMMMARSEVDCRKRRSRLYELAFYDSLGHNLRHHGQSEPLAWQNLIPTSAGEDAMITGCRVYARKS